eukprot:CAMPEP_0197119778 /NCGR_PEP_ID=MMETSP1390-20130617/2524_1 /TAXON_ID=38833 /ORGANISM="Micromonas sp., Strain CCMP2099" /LENGTH=104 /DNA_ID=CAMNT_0042561555 /DNA_START=347 /DNA_END=661 /DNA_ORIENTATION=+
MAALIRNNALEPRFACATKALPLAACVLKNSPNLDSGCDGSVTRAPATAAAIARDSDGTARAGWKWVAPTADEAVVANTHAGARTAILAEPRRAPAVSKRGKRG